MANVTLSQWEFLRLVCEIDAINRTPVYADGCPTCGAAGRTLEETAKREMRACDNEACERNKGVVWFQTVAA